MRKSNARTEKMKLSYIRTIMERAREMEYNGKKIVHLEIGEPDFDTPLPIVEATIQALRNGYTHYGPDEGLDELKAVIAKKIFRTKGIETEKKNMIITAGASEAIFDALVGLTGPGQRVIIPEPSFGNYYNCCICAGSTPVNIPLKLDRHCRIDFEKLEEVVDENTGFIVINNPHNPTGAVFSADEITKLADFAMDRDLMVITDEIYEDLYYGDKKPLPIASLKGMKERTVMIGGFSKSYAMTGWRVGYLIVPPDLVESVQKIHQYAVTCVSTFSQVGIAGSIESCDHDLQYFKNELNKRRQYLVGQMEKIANISYIEPEGAFYLFINIKRFGISSIEFTERLLEEHGLAAIPGSAFGAAGEGFIRLSYAASLDEIRKGADLFRTFIAGLEKRI